VTQFDVSVGISPRQSFESWAAFVAALEAEGVGRVWVIDSQLAMKDVYTGLVLAALNTRSLDLGTGVTNAVTRHPTITANAMAALAEISHGRAFLGLGAGDSALYGVGMKPQKVAEVEEAIDFFQAVLSGEEGQLGGRKYRLPHVAAKVPVYLAVSQERMCELAGRKADGAIVMGPAQPDMVERQVGWIAAGLKAAGRRHQDFDISFVATMSAEVDDVRSWASTQARLLTHYKELPNSLLPFRDEIMRSADSYDYAEHLSTRAGHSAAVSDDLTRALAVVGRPDECAARLRELRSAGVDTLMFPLTGRNRIERWRVIRDEIIPHIIV
jgi:5,10-methylenetetrahydromethanopterin reductase